MECRVGCAACCIAISISSKIPKMPNGKAAGVPCAHLTSKNQCELFNKPERPAVCIGFKPDKDFCGNSNSEAMDILSKLESSTCN